MINSILSKTASMHGLLRSLTNMGMRGASIATRFVLAIYLAKFIGLEAVGVYGLITGVIAVAPALISFGLHFLLNREIVSMDTYDALVRIKNRTAVTVTLLAIGMAVFLTLHALGLFPLHFNAFLVCIIIFFEVLFADFQLSLISMRKPLLSNFLLFIRAASWVPVFIAVSYFMPAYRSIDFLFVCWLGSIGAALIAVYLSFRHVPLIKLAKEKVDTKWIVERMKSSWLIYISDLGGAGFGNVDRFLLVSMLGLFATGIYSFYWSLAYGLVVLVQAAIVQISLPRLVASYSPTDNANWLSTMKTFVTKTVATGAVLAVVIYTGITFAIPYLDTKGLTDYPLFFPLLLLASVLKLAADMLHYGLYSRKLDKALALINISSLLAGIALSYVFISLLGLIGVCVAMIVLALGLISVRGYILMKDVKSLPAAEQV